MQKQIAKAMPTWARALERVSRDVTSDRIALRMKYEHLAIEEFTSNVHRQLDVSLTQATNNARKHVRCKRCTLNPPAGTAGQELRLLLRTVVDVHECRQDVSNHRQ